ncbi:cupin domain-containing protein [Nitrospirillum sp. BR 11828]|uniref:cupin domain-containing protein n=1 Tax=Nitrospirillum sp. BR 11828 TaxID=3104325 RepID=UPI002ACAACED|nr:cupin domain-containing protein [Nitrospirillum sp. BR 11828]MDZ5647412.1 cupin domain-containing protein [Nitrospirillum sp. BR 11828]
MDVPLDADSIIRLLGLKPHPEGGHYVETYRHAPAGGGRGSSTAIYFLLKAGERSHWHRVLDADEVWHWHAGAPLRLSLSADGRATAELILGTDLLAGQRPQGVVPAGQWQAAESLGDWTLVGCTVAPAFEFQAFEMAPAGWVPGNGHPADGGSA